MGMKGNSLLSLAKSHSDNLHPDPLFLEIVRDFDLNS